MMSGSANPDETPAEPSPIPTASMKKKKKKRKKSSSDAIQQPADVNSTKLSIKKRIFLKKSAKQTPWYDVNELMSTGRDLIIALKLFPSPHNSSTLSSDNVHDKLPEAPLGLTNDEYCQLHAALKRVALWRGRSDRGGRLPHAIDVTAGLAGVLLMDAERCHNTSNMNSIQRSNISHYQVRNAYSTLLLRSVNGLADTYRHQKKSALLSVSHCCSLAGLPPWIVDVRHDASHNDLPSLGVCRIGALESLKFWKKRYWDALDEKVWGENHGTRSETKKDNPDSSPNDLPEAGTRTLAIDCLMRYQKALNIEASERRTVARTKKIKPEKKEYQRFSYWQQVSRENRETESHSGQANAAKDDVMMLPSDEDNINPDKIDGSPNKKQKIGDVKVNPWWILDDTKPKKKKEKKTPEVVQEINPLVSVSTEPSSRDCAAELIKLTPVDVLYATTLEFLVWGGTSNSPLNAESRCPALIASFTSKNVSNLHVDIEDAFEELRILYEPLIVSVTSTYPGFLVALFVHLNDSILCIDSENRKLHNESNGDSVNNLKETEWNLKCLAMWACYILTREFHMHLDRSIAVIDQIADETANQKVSELVDLKKKGRRKWSPLEHSFMQSFLPYQLLCNSGVPLNSVCDRLLSHIACESKIPNEQSTDIVAELLLLYQTILGKERVLFGISEPSTENTDGSVDARINDNLKPWTLCKSWDACAIGTMPGCPG
eukprot:scaffold25997_cov68-Cyclotella_meneghiniana.AAC.5